MGKEDHYQKGMELFGDDQLEDSIQELKKAIEEDPDYGDALHALAMCCFHAERLDEAIQYGERLKDAEPDNTLAYTTLSMLYNAKGWKEKAEDMGAKAQAAGFRANLADSSD